jgi:hypothetical protein
LPVQVSNRDQLLRILDALSLTSVYKPDLHMLEAVAANADIEEWYPVTIAHIHQDKDEPDMAELAKFDVVYEDSLLPAEERHGLKGANAKNRDERVPFRFFRGYEGGFLPSEIQIGQKLDCRYRTTGHKTRY